MEHTKDEDCTMLADYACVECGTHHGDPCPDCGARAFHKPECRELALADLRGDVSDMRRVNDQLTRLAVSFERQAEYWKREASRYADRCRELENRARHATEALQGAFAAPTIDELRDLRGIEALDPWITEAVPFVPSMRDTGDLPLTPEDSP